MDGQTDGLTDFSKLKTAITIPFTTWSSTAISFADSSRLSRGRERRCLGLRRRRRRWRRHRGSWRMKSRWGAVGIFLVRPRPFRSRHSGSRRRFRRCHRRWRHRRRRRLVRGVQVVTDGLNVMRQRSHVLENSAASWARKFVGLSVNLIRYNICNIFN